MPFLTDPLYRLIRAAKVHGVCYVAFGSAYALAKVLRAPPGSSSAYYALLATVPTGLLLYSLGKRLDRRQLWATHVLTALSLYHFALALFLAIRWINFQSIVVIVLFFPFPVLCFNALPDARRLIRQQRNSPQPCTPCQPTAPAPAVEPPSISGMRTRRLTPSLPAFTPAPFGPAHSRRPPTPPPSAS